MSIEIIYARIGSKEPAAYKTFTGPDASIQAANYQSAHPELYDISFKVKR
jgi:hypothetical protein